MSDIDQEAAGPAIPQSQMIGTRLYPPWLLVTYCVAAPPIAVFLYGINIQRRGSKATGIILKTVAALTIVLTTIDAALDLRMKGGGLLSVFGIVFALGLYHIEKRPYRISISQGARPARWWPPLLFILAQAAVIYSSLFACHRF